MENKWYVKNTRGQVHGPYSKEEVVEKIRQGYFLGEEQVSHIEEGTWQPITKHSVFFEAFLDQLDQKTNSEDQEDYDDESLPSFQGEIKSSQEEEKSISFEDIDIEPEKEATRENIQVDLNKVPKSAIHAQPKKTEEPTATKEPTIKKKKKFSIPPQIFFIVSAALFFLLLVQEMGESEKQEEKIRLTKVLFNSKPVGVPSSQLLKKAILRFRQHTVEDYLGAQDLLVSALEAEGSYLDAMGFLCMVYKELWPHTYQDSADIAAVHSLYQKASLIRSSSSSAGVCFVVYQWVIGQYDKAQSYMADALRRAPSLLLFNQLMGDFHEQEKKYQTAIYYFQKVKELWPPPPWLKPILQEARVYRRLQKYSEAVAVYTEALEYFPNHPHIFLELGVLEFQAFNHFEKAEKLIQKALSTDHTFNINVLAEAYFVLAKISLQSGAQMEALNYANRSFAIDSSSKEVKEFILGLGGRGALESIPLNSGNMLYLGTQYLKVGDYFAAQAEFRAAYKVNPKNALAAYYAGKALWELNQTKEAKEWIEKAIKADPHLISAYVTLARYYSLRFDYEKAVSVLRKIRSRYPRSNQIYWGFAFVEFQRKNFLSAIKLAERALSLYPMDVEALILIIKSYIEIQDFDSAYKFVERTLELDPHSPEVQVLYAKVLTGLYGISAGLDFLKGKMRELPEVQLFKEALADIYMSERNWQGAEIILVELITLDPDDKESTLKLADTYKNQNRFNESLEMYLKAASLDALDPTPLFRAGLLYMETGDPGSASSQFERVLKINDQYPRVYYHMGEAAYTAKQYQKAIRLAKEEKRRNPKIVEPYMLAARAYEKLEFFNDCAKEYQQAILLRSQSAQIYVDIARCYRLAGALEEALSMLDQAQQKESGMAAIYKELGAIYLMKNLKPQARATFKKYLSLEPNARDKKQIYEALKELKEE